MLDTENQPENSSTATQKLPPQSRFHRLLFVGAAMLSLLFFTVLIVGLWIRGRVVDSLPKLDGEIIMADLEGSVDILRDGNGVTTLRGNSRIDLVRATGFVHAQDRFFQMDLMRRKAAGELGLLFGPAAGSWDRRIRAHSLRHVALVVLANTPKPDLAILEAYAEGVNAGLQALDDKPPEYLLLRVDPEPWEKEDSVLVVLAMFIEMHDEEGKRESCRAVMHDVLPEPLFAFLNPLGTEWDAPIVGEPMMSPPIPGPEVADLRSLQATRAFQATSALQAVPHAVKSAVMLGREDNPAGSNNWAVAGRFNPDGGAILANDMHLGLSVPNTWYRLQLAMSGFQVNGVTLPGVPVMVVGSNGHVAWGLTNSYGDFTDLVVLDPNPKLPEDCYLTPEGSEYFYRDEEIIEYSDGSQETIEVLRTIWGPVIDRDHKGRHRVLRWTAHDHEATNLGLLELENARTVHEAVEIANRSGLPPQNFVCADADGHIAWTIAGALPRRVGFDGVLPTSWSDGTRTWDGWLEPEEYPRVIDPPSGRLWTANSRVVDGEMLNQIRDGGYELGARAGQIRDRLMALESANEWELYLIQLDDEALFLLRWHDQLLEVLTPEAVAADQRRAELRQLVEDWGGRAAVDSAGYLMVRTYRNLLCDQLMEFLTAQVKQADERFRQQKINQREGPVWRLVSEQPLHLLNPSYASWHEQFLAAVDATIKVFTEDGSSLAEHTWGKHNTVKIQHPLSMAVPALEEWLNMTYQPLPGDSYMPRVQGIDFGASQRMVVTPGRENQGIMQMPCGPSGHPLSPFYRTGHEAWVTGHPSAFLPGPTVHTLVLLPG